MRKPELEHEGTNIKIRATGGREFVTFQGREFHPEYYSLHKESTTHDKEHVVGLIGVGHGVPLEGGEADIITRMLLPLKDGHEVLQSVINNAKQKGRKQVLISVFQDRGWIESMLKKIGIENKYVPEAEDAGSHIKVEL